MPQKHGDPQTGYHKAGADHRKFLIDRAGLEKGCSPTLETRTEISYAPGRHAPDCHPRSGESESKP